MAETREVSNGPPQCSRVVLAKPRLGGPGAAAAPTTTSGKANPFGSVLRPSQLKPSSNPFLKVNNEADMKETEQETNNSQPEANDTPKFMPLGTSNASGRTSNNVPNPGPQPAASSGGFVFGQNLSERVVMAENVNNGNSDTDHSSTNGTSELLFTNAAANVKETNQEQPSGEGSGEGLAAAAAAYQRSHARPPPPSYCAVTGEEEEINVLQISCRLFAWEAGGWRERGRGVLRLNDARDGGARLVGRAAGSLRLVLNTKLWPAMVAERAGTRSLRITAVDVQHRVKLFLIMGAPSDIAALHRALLSRIPSSKKAAAAEEAGSQEAAERLDSRYADDDAPDAAPRADDAADPAADDVTDHADGDVTPADCGGDDVTDEAADEARPLKRKEPAEGDTSPKRQCPKIVVE